MKTFLSVCSGIEAVSVALKPIGWKAKAFSEIDEACCLVLEKHWPEVRNVGDIRNVTKADIGDIDLFIAGTPCQGFSQAGTKSGLHHADSILALEYVRIVREFCPTWIEWENVPGCLTTNGGKDFCRFLSELSGVDISVPPNGWGNTGVIVGTPGYHSLCWRVLDSQYFGVPQKRRRVFLVGRIGTDWRYPAAVLLEPGTMQEHRYKSRASLRSPSVAAVRTAFGGANGHGISTLAHTLDTIPTGQAVCTLRMREGKPGGGKGPLISQDVSLTLATHNDQVVFDGEEVRRFTPKEYARLMGFPDDHCDIPGVSDDVRYKMLGNSMPVPVMRWIGEGMNMVDESKVGIV